VQVLGLDDEGKIADLTVFLRPIRAGMALSELMGPKITNFTTAPTVCELAAPTRSGRDEQTPPPSPARMTE